MLVANAGMGKSVLVGDKLGLLDSEKYMIKNVPFNYYTSSAMLQGTNCAGFASVVCVLCSCHLCINMCVCVYI